MIPDVPVRQAVLSVARALRWVRETEGSNKGEMVNQILASVHLPPGEPWCAAFVSFVGKAALGDAWPLPMVGGCQTLAEDAAKRNMRSPLPAPGSVFLLWSSTKKRFHHTGFCVAPGPKGWKTIEGNTSEDGSPEGTGVFERDRMFGLEDRFIRWFDGPQTGVRWTDPAVDP